MPYEEKIIAADGSGDFNTLQQWEDWRRLQTNPAQRAIVRNAGNVGPVVISGGPTLSSASFPEIVGDVLHDGTDGIGSFAESSTQTVIENHVAFLRVRNLRIRHGNQYGIDHQAGQLGVSACLIVGTDASTYKAGVRFAPTAALDVLTLSNCFVVYGLAGNPGSAGDAQAAILLDATAANADAVVKNTTIVGTTGMKAAVAATRSSGSHTALLLANENILCTALTKRDTGSILSIDGGSSYNIYAEASIGSNAIGPLTAADVVVDPATDWKLITDSPAIDAAPSGLDADAFGTIRPKGSDYDIGAQEFIPIGSNGLIADYWNGYGENNALPFPTDPPSFTLIEATVDHSEGANGFSDNPPGLVAPPGRDIGDFFAVRWHGFVRARYSETYTITVNHDDGIRLWIDGTSIIDDWTDGETTDTGTIALTAGVKVPIVLEFYQSTGPARAHLKWESMSQTLEVIPESCLFTGAIGTSTFRVVARGVAVVVPSFVQTARGAASVFNSYIATARGQASVAYESFTSVARGTCTVANTFTVTGRGICRVAYSSFLSTGRGACDVLNTFTCVGRGIATIYQAFAVEARGEARVANNALARYEIYHGLGASPDLTAAPEATFTSLPHDTGTLATNTVHHFVIRQRNAWGLISQNIDEFIVDLSNTGVQNPTKPSDPVEVNIAAGPAGVAIVTAQYLYGADGANAADKWLVYIAVNATPSVGSTTPTVLSIVKSDGIGKLRYQTAAQSEGAIVRVIVRVRRSGTVAAPSNVDSADATVHAATMTLLGPAAVSPRGIFIGTEHEQHQ